MDKFEILDKDNQPDTLLTIKNPAFGMGTVVPTAGVEFSNMDVLYAWLRDVPLLQVDLSCGCKAKYHDHCDVPRESVKCEHGNYFIKVG